MKVRESRLVERVGVRWAVCDGTLGLSLSCFSLAPFALLHTPAPHRLLFKPLPLGT
jgi:hypothetical protein